MPESALASVLHCGCGMAPRGGFLLGSQLPLIIWCGAMATCCCKLVSWLRWGAVVSGFCCACWGRSLCPFLSMTGVGRVRREVAAPGTGTEAGSSRARRRAEARVPPARAPASSGQRRDRPVDPARPVHGRERGYPGDWPHLPLPAALLGCGCPGGWAGAWTGLGCCLHPGGLTPVLCLPSSAAVWPGRAGS